MMNKKHFESEFIIFDMYKSYDFYKVHRSKQGFQLNE